MSPSWYSGEGRLHQNSSHLGIYRLIALSRELFQPHCADESGPILPPRWSAVRWMSWSLCTRNWGLGGPQGDGTAARGRSAEQAVSWLLTRLQRFSALFLLPGPLMVFPPLLNFVLDWGVGDSRRL